MSHNIKEGMVTEFSRVTNSADAYTAPGQTALDFLVSTPAIVTMVIEGSAKMLDALVPSENITIGTDLQLSHLHATFIGEQVTFKVKVAKVEGNTIYLEFEGKDSDGIFCNGTYQRHVVNKVKLVESVQKRFAIG